MGFGRMDGCGQCMKFSLFIANFIIFIGGVVVLGIGIWTLVDKGYLTELLGTNLFLGAVYILILTGVIVALIAFFGCLGAVKEVRCMLLTYFIIVFLIFITMLVGGILGYVFRGKVNDTMYKAMYGSLSEYDKNSAITTAWDATQSQLNCCGVNGPDDWKPVLNRPPESCCAKDPCIDGQPINKEGCLPLAEKTIKAHATIIGGAGIGVACLMLLGMIFSCALFQLIE